MAVALITGASSGLGEAAARRLAREPGLALVLVARRAERLEQLAASLPCEATGLPLDLLDEDAPARARAHLEEHHGGRLDLLVNNAGAGGRGTFAETGAELARRTMALNFDAQLRLTEALLPLLREAAPSAIVNIASTAGRVGRAGRGRLLAPPRPPSPSGATRCRPRSTSTASTSAPCSPASSRRRASRSASSPRTG